jgi:hypothetical protein
MMLNYILNMKKQDQHESLYKKYAGKRFLKVFIPHAVSAPTHHDFYLGQHIFTAVGFKTVAPELDCGPES